MTQLDLIAPCRVPERGTQCYELLMAMQRGARLTVAKAITEHGVYALSQGAENCAMTMDGLSSRATSESSRSTGLRRAAKVDANQNEIVDALRKIGVSVLHLHQVGKGCPDLLCWHRHRYVLLEVKVPGEGPNKEQVEFIDRWPGELHIVHSVTEALVAILGKEVMA